MSGVYIKMDKVQRFELINDGETIHSSYRSFQSFSTLSPLTKKAIFINLKIILSVKHLWICADVGILSFF